MTWEVRRSAPKFLATITQIAARKDLTWKSLSQQGCQSVKMEHKQQGRHWRGRFSSSSLPNILKMWPWRSWTKLFVGTLRLSVNLQRKTWSGGTKWPRPTGHPQLLPQCWRRRDMTGMQLGNLSRVFLLRNLTVQEYLTARLVLMIPGDWVCQKILRGAWIIGPQTGNTEMTLMWWQWGIIAPSQAGQAQATLALASLSLLRARTDGWYLQSLINTGALMRAFFRSSVLANIDGVASVQC